MIIRTYITAYNRPKMLKSIISHLSGFGIEPIIFEDGVTHEHRGKKGFWQTWDEILKDCEKNEADLYIFMPDDFLNIDIEKIVDLHNQFKRSPYVYNIINDGRHQCWGGFKKCQPINGTEQVGFTDCGFFCNREALQKTKWRIKPVDPKRWIKYPNMSSGVGQQLTTIFTNGKVKMYKPVKSLAYHGEHDSMMHPNERNTNPLISK